MSIEPNSVMFVAGALAGFVSTIGGARLMMVIENRRLRRALDVLEMRQRDWILATYFTPRPVPKTWREMVAEEVGPHREDCPCGGCAMERVKAREMGARPQEMLN